MSKALHFETLAIGYLNDQDKASRLQNLAIVVAEWREHDEAPGKRRARKADLEAVAKTARRLKTALDKIDPRTRLDAIKAGAGRTAPGPRVVNADFACRMAGALRLTDSLDVLAEGYGRLAETIQVVRSGGQPPRHDALVFGLEELAKLWRLHRRDEPTQSFVRPGFGALAIELFAGAPVGFDEGTVQDAVIDFLRGRSPPEVGPPG
jgi:hypothetical protein